MLSLCMKSILHGFGIALISVLLVLPSMGFSEKQGPFEWHPERSPSGHVVIIVSLPDQQVSVYRGGKRIARAPVSTGKQGHKTPTGVFTILQKDVHHHSSKYNNASMPYTERLTWSGVALHAGGLPGYPESHGCIHLSLEFSKLLFSITHIGTAVIIADNRSAPGSVTHPGPFLPALAQQEAEQAVAKLRGKKLPHPKHRKVQTVKTASSGDIPLGHTAILVSGKDRIIQVWDGDKKILQAPVSITNPNRPLGTHLYSLSGIGSGGSHIQWSSVHVGGDDRGSGNIIKRVQMSDAVASKIVHMLHPGASFVITDNSLAAKTRTGNGFVVMRQR